MTHAKQWFAIRTRPHKESIAKTQYERQGYTVYLPMTQKTIRHARKTDKVLRPFIPGYLFLHLAPAERDWVTIGSTIGAIGAVHFGDQYPPVPDEVIDIFKNRESAQGYIHTQDQRLSGLRKGGKIQITAGEFAGIEGLFIEQRGEDRALIFIELLKRQVISNVPLASLETI